MLARLRLCCPNHEAGKLVTLAEIEDRGGDALVRCHPKARLEGSMMTPSINWARSIDHSRSKPLGVEVVLLDAAGSVVIRCPRCHRPIHFQASAVDRIATEGRKRVVVGDIVRGGSVGAV
jgi:uncharacterized C2H2 Zn-finger protein